MADEIDPTIYVDAETPSISSETVRGASSKAVNDRAQVYVDKRLKERLVDIKFFTEKAIVDEALRNWIYSFINTVHNTPNELSLSSTWNTFDRTAKALKISPAILARIATRIMNAILEGKTPNSDTSLFTHLRELASFEKTDLSEVVVRLIISGLEAEKIKKTSRNRR